MNHFCSWGRYPSIYPKVLSASHLDSSSMVQISASEISLLAVGMGRSYGDSCLPSSKGLAVSMLSHNRILEFDAVKGIIRCQSGMTFDDLLSFLVPRKWFLPVSPGTKYITLGGAVANDVHGKNHHQSGTFCHWVSKIRLLRTDGEVIECSPSENNEMFQATVGGLGLTGFIDWVEIKLLPIKSSQIELEIIPFYDLNEYFKLSEQSKNFVYTVSWVDCLSKKNELGRGLFIRGNHSTSSEDLSLHKQRINIPVDFPSFAVNSWTTKVFNSIYFRKTFLQKKRLLQHYDPFFYPLDSIRNWNRVYGKRGFLQYQFVAPPKDAKAVVSEVLNLVAKSGQPSPLSVLKDFGTKPSIGYLSFPRQGTTLAVDVPFNGERTLKLLDSLDEIVMSANGAVYPAKDARMSKKMFAVSFPDANKFEKHRDKKLSSRFYNRVTGVPI